MNKLEFVDPPPKGSYEELMLYISDLRQRIEDDENLIHELQKRVKELEQ